MIAIGVRFLCGWSASMDVSSREMAEWPPHPARLFMALAAAHFETGGDVAERAALEWLESQPPPALQCSDASQRDTAGVYVPVNDVESGIAILPAQRTKQLRKFPRAIPNSDALRFIWADSEPHHAIALEALCRKVTRIGHSSSLVQVWMETEIAPIPQPAIVPDDFGADRLRVPWAGFLRQLEADFNAAAIEEYEKLEQALTDASPKVRKRIKDEMRARFPGGPPRSKRPQCGSWSGYKRNRTVSDEVAAGQTPFDPNLLILTKVDGPSLGLESTLQLTGALRDAAMNHAVQPSPEWVSGHAAGGAPSSHPHLAFFPLPYVGGEHGDGHVMGLAIAVPRGIDAAELRDNLGPLFFNPETGEPRSVKLWKKDRQSNTDKEAKAVWRWELDREDRISPPLTLQQETWTSPSCCWATVTPMVLHHFPKKNREGSVEAIVREACAMAGLPDPLTVITSSVSWFRGAGHIRDIPFYEGREGLSRFHIHVRLVFDRPVKGPVLVGRGRYRGYGLFRPWDGDR